MSNETLERYDRDCVRIRRSEHIVGMILRLANGQWGLFDTNDKRVTRDRVAFRTPKEALDYFQIKQVNP